MIVDRWKLFRGIGLILSVQTAFAGEAWLLIASDLPGVVVLVDGAYRGTTPEQPGDALRIQVPEGVRVIEVRKPINGKEKEYTARQTVEIISDKETFVQFNFDGKSSSASVSSKNVDMRSTKPIIQSIYPYGELEIPGKNF